jgi:hypothetical protein
MDDIDEGQQINPSDLDPERPERPREIDPELRTAIATYLRETSAALLSEVGEDEFSQYIEVMARGAMSHIFRMMYGALGRYPTSEDLNGGGLRMMLK